ncbi:condensation domain-containing protein [Actinomycetes bacterium M1A6_2h]
MEFTELADYPLPAGVLTQWTPTVGDGGEAWSEDDRPLAYTHEAHCRHSLTAGADPNSEAAWIGAAFEIHSGYQPDAVRRALRAWTVRHETFRTTVVSKDGGGLMRLTVPGERIDIESHSDGKIRSGAWIHDHLVDYFGSTLSPFRWPHCLVATVHDPTRSGFLLVFAADHSVMDAYSMLLAISELRRLYEFECHGTDPLLAEIGSHVDFSAIDRRLGDSVTADHHAVEVWSDFLEARSPAGPTFPEFPLPVTVDDAGSTSAHQSSLSSWLLTSDETDALARTCRSNGHGMQSGVLAALAMTGRHLTGDTVRFVMPLHTRFEPRYAQSVGWYVGVVPIEIAVEHDASLAQCLPSATAAVENVAELARLPYSKIADLLGVTDTPRFVVSYLDLRHTPDSAHWSRWRARTLRGSAASPDEVYLWILRTPLGLNVSARFPSNEKASRNVHRFVTTLASTVRTEVMAER